MNKPMIAILALVLFSCSPSTDPDIYLPDANGKHGDILLLIENDVFNSDIGQLIDANMNKHPEGVYLRKEPMFSYFHKTPDELNYMNKLNRNILKVTIEPDSAYPETQVRILPNYFAKNQLFVLVKDSDEDRLSDFLLNDWDQISDEFNNHELNEYMRAYRKDPNDNIQEMAQKDFGIDINLPSDSELKSNRNGVAWVKRDRSHRLTKNDATNADGGTFWVQQGIVFWSEPYDSAAQMSIPYILQKRDTVLKYNIAGKVPNSYMATEYDPYYKPIGRKFKHKGAQATEIRGLWKHAGNRGAFGGGPFVQYTILNKAKNEMVTVLGYIYGPKFDKREYIRELDAMLQSIEII